MNGTQTARQDRAAGKTLIKICGLRRPQDIDYVNAARPDMAGFIMSPGYRRSVAPETAAQLRAKLDPAIQAVGVFVDEDPEVIAEAASLCRLDMIQLHGSEESELIRRLQKKLGLPVIKAMKAGDYDSDCPADMVLLDSGKGTGKVFDWSTIPPIVHKQWFLAGGIDAGNAAEAIAAVHPDGLDFSSGVETDGVKDPQKITAIVERIRGL